MAVIHRVHPQHVDAVFPHAGELLQKALDRGLGEVELSTIFEHCRTGSQQLWLGFDENTRKIILAFTTEIVTYPTGQKQLHMHLTGGTEYLIDKWMNDWSGPVEDFCRQEGIKYVHTTGRPGWVKYLKPMGYTKYYEVLVKEILND